MFTNEILNQIDLESGTLAGVSPDVFKLSDLSGCYSDRIGYRQLCRSENPEVYRLSVVETSGEDGNINYLAGMLQPGRVGAEYFFSRGHIHRSLETPETYYCLKGGGLMLLQNERTGDCRLSEFSSGSIFYIPDFTAHRVINVGSKPLLFLGRYGAEPRGERARFHEKRFQSIVAATPHGPELMSRRQFRRLLH